MKMKGSMAKIPIKRLYKKDSLGILRRNRLDLLGIHKPKSNRFKWMLRIVLQKLFNRPKLSSFCKTAYRMILIPNDNPMGIPLPIGQLSPYA